MTESERLTFKTDVGISIDKNEDCPTCSICWNCDRKVSDCNYFNDAVERLAMYEDIGTVSEFRELKEKATAKKQGNIHDLDSHLRLSKSGFLCCGVTNKDLRYPIISLRDFDYCPRCGQKLDWSEGKE